MVIPKSQIWIFFLNQVKIVENDSGYMYGFGLNMVKYSSGYSSQTH